MSVRTQPNGQSNRGRAILLWLGWVSFVATVVVILWGARLTEPDPTPQDSYSRHPLGHRALAETLDELGFEFRRDRELRDRDGEDLLWFIEPDLVADIEGYEVRLAHDLEARRRRGQPSVVVLPKWRVARDRLGEGVRPVSTDAVDAVLAAAWSGSDAPRPDWTRHEQPLQAGDLDMPFPQTVRATSPDVEVVAGTAEFAVVVIDRSTPGAVVLIADADIVHNWNIQRGGHGDLVQAIQRRVKSRGAVIDEVQHGHGLPRSIARELGRFPLVLLTVHGLLVLGLVAWAGSKRFGPPRSGPAVGHAAVTDVAAAILAAGEQPSRLAAAYVRRVLSDAHARVGSGRAETDDLAVLARRIDDVAKRRGIEPGAEDLLRRTRQLHERRGARVRRSVALVRRAWAFRHRFLPSSRNKGGLR